MSKILSGHTTPETAYIVEDYPYGFRLRCRIRYWLEYKPGKGFRLSARILSCLAEVILQGSFPMKEGTPMMLRDINGNVVGKAQVKA